MNHTPTPWAIETNVMTSRTYLTHKRALVFEVRLAGYDDVAAKLNAHDELVAALRYLTQQAATSLPENNDALINARAALAKAQS